MLHNSIIVGYSLLMMMMVALQKRHVHENESDKERCFVDRQKVSILINDLQTRTAYIN